MFDLTNRPLDYAVAIFITFMVIAFFEAYFYCKDNGIKEKAVFFKISFISNAILGIIFFIPYYYIDFVVLGLYVVRSVIVHKWYYEYNPKTRRDQSRASFIYTQMLVFFVLCLYNLAFFIIRGIFGYFAYALIAIILGLLYYKINNKSKRHR